MKVGTEHGAGDSQNPPTPFKGQTQAKPPKVEPRLCTYLGTQGDRDPNDTPDAPETHGLANGATEPATQVLG